MLSSENEHEIVHITSSYNNISASESFILTSLVFGNEQHIAFARIERNGEISSGIPCGTFVTTTTGDHIHTPKDKARLFDFENMAGLVDHLAEMIIWLSHSDKDIEWTDPGFTRINNN